MQFLVAIQAIVYVTAAAQAAEPPPYIAAIDARAQALYGPLMKVGETFRIEHIPGKDSSVVASAARDPANEFRVRFDSGFVNSPRLTPDAYRFGLCHEIGHLFGGIPRRAAPEGWEGPLDEAGKMLLSGEGQADYYASRACFRRLVEGENHAQFLAGKEIPASLRQECESPWGAGTSEAQICQRAAIGSFEMLRLVFDFKISLEAKDTEIVNKTLDVYPSRQCRLDTAVSGALCKDPVPLDLNDHEVSSYGCAQGPGARPACWYKR